MLTLPLPWRWLLPLVLLNGIAVGGSGCRDDQRQDDCGGEKGCGEGWVMGNAGCEPCTENGTAYFGNNVLPDPVPEVENQHKCRAMCLATPRCNYFTYDVAEQWCYLKHKKNKTLQEPKMGPFLSRFISGTKTCLDDEENEIEEEKTPENNDMQEIKKSKIDKGIPLLSIQNPEGYTSVLSTLPATFGMQINPSTKISGRVEFADPLTLCSSSERRHHATSYRSTFVAVDRGGCKFTEKAVLAALAGYNGVIILDNKNNTGVRKISGDHVSRLDRVPVLFLLKKEAEIFRSLLKENPNMKIMIEDSSVFTWFGRRGSTSPTTTTTTKKPILGMRDSIEWLFKHPKNHRNRFNPRLGIMEPNFGGNSRPADFTRSSRTQAGGGQTVDSVDPVVKTYSSSSLHMTPLTLGSLVVGVVLGLLLLISVATLVMGRYNRKARRRAHTTRCQMAIRDFERQRQSQDNAGFHGEEDVTSQSGEPNMPNSAKNLLECPVCLDLAWPPTRIFQCREGHIVCENCKSNSNLRVCPMCRIPLTSNNVSRNRQLEELARTLLMELDSSETSPTAPPLPPLPTISASIPHNVFHVDPQLNVMMEREEEEWIREFGANRDTEGENAGQNNVEEHIADIVLEPRPLTVLLPPEPSSSATNDSTVE